MANGQKFDRYAFTAACQYFSLGTLIRVVNVRDGSTVMVLITDRGPSLRLHRIVDLSEAAAEKLGYIDQGLTQVFIMPVANVKTESATFDEEPTEPQIAQDTGTTENQY